MRLGIRIFLVFIVVSITQQLYSQKNNNMEIATFGSGCFWCTEAIFQQLNGVESAVSGYSGGTVKNPTYKEVCTGNTGHAEVIQVTFNPEIISYKELLEVFWQTHDPTTLNRQGNDVGSQYRSGIYFTEQSQQEIAQMVLNQLETEAVFDNKIVTEIKKATPFYRAEDEHINYFNQNKEQPYCTYTINPKMEKLKHYFSNYLNKSYER